MKQNELYLDEAMDVIEEVLSSGGSFRLYPKGTSMLPWIVQGRDSVVLKRRDGVPAKKYEIAFYRRADGQLVLHRVMKRHKDGTYTMCGDNHMKREKGIRSEQILAYVDEFYCGEQAVNMSAWSYRLRVWLRSFWPVRCICLTLEHRKAKKCEKAGKKGQKT